MNTSLKGRIAVVTGSGSGIGAAVARGLGRAGATVVVHHHASEEGARAVADDVEASGSEALVLQADLTDRESVRRTFDTVLDRFGRVDVLVNNTGGLVRRAPVDEADDELFEQVLELNLGTVFSACRAVVPAMRSAGGGSIINLSSIAARNGGGNGSSLYCAGKGAVSAYTRALAKELAPHGIRVNAVSPGIIDTAFHAQTPPEAFQAMVTAIPMGRPGRPEEVVGPVLFLADEEMSSFVTGHVLEVNGGHVLG